MMKNLLSKVKAAAMTLLFCVCIATGTMFCLQKRAELSKREKDLETLSAANRQRALEIDTYQKYQKRIQKDTEFLEWVLHSGEYYLNGEIIFTHP